MKPVKVAAAIGTAKPVSKSKPIYKVGSQVVKRFSAKRAEPTTTAVEEKNGKAS